MVEVNKLPVRWRWGGKAAWLHTGTGKDEWEDGATALELCCPLVNEHFRAANATAHGQLCLSPQPLLGLLSVTHTDN